MTVDSITLDASAEGRREDLHGRLAAFRDGSLLGRSVGAVGHAVLKLFPGSTPLPYGASAAILTAVIGAVAGVEVLLEGATWAEDRALLALRLAFLGGFALMLWVHRMTFRATVPVMRDHLLEAIERPEDLRSLERLLNPFPGARFPAVVILALLAAALLQWLDDELGTLGQHAGASISPSLILIRGGFVLGILSILGFAVFCVRLGRWRLKLYPPDPSRSEVILRVSGLLRTLLSLLGLFGVSITLAFTALGLTDWFNLGVGLVLLLWIPIVGLFVAGHRSLGRLITRAKWREMRRIQHRVERLRAEGDLEEKETMEAVRRLMEYHDQVARRPDSVLDLRASLNFVNSLLLPLVAFVLANLELVLEHFF